jgi:hypothetical protein
VVSSPAAMNEVVVELGVLGSRLRTGPVGGHVLSFFVITSLLLIGGRRNHVGGGSLRRRPRLFDTTDGTSVGRLIRPRMSDLRRCLLRGRRHQRSSGRGRARTDQVRDQPSPAGLMRGTEGALRSADSRGGQIGPRHHLRTVPWLFGPHVDAVVRVGINRAGVLDGIDAHLREYGLDSVSETADGEDPHAATGCLFQAGR